MVAGSESQSCLLLGGTGPMTRVQTVGIRASGRGAVGGVGRSTSRAVCWLWMVPEGPSGACVVMVAELCGQAGRGGCAGCWDSSRR